MTKKVEQKESLEGLQNKDEIELEKLKEELNILDRQEKVLKEEEELEQRWDRLKRDQKELESRKHVEG